jgi:large subunit ribosomal protein L5
MNRLNLWQKQILKKDYIYKLQKTNTQSLPELVKVIINICMNDAVNDSKQILLSIIALELITNQKPIIYRSKKSIAAFKLKKNIVIGCKIILRKSNMFDFLDSFIFLVLPKLINFKGFTNVCSYRPINNISIGLFDILNFPQVNTNSVLFKKIGGTFMFFTKTSFPVINLILNSYQMPHLKA